MNDQVMVDPRVKIGVYIYIYIYSRFGGSKGKDWRIQFAELVPLYLTGRVTHTRHVLASD